MGPGDEEADLGDPTTLVVDFNREIWTVWDDETMDTLHEGAVAVPLGEEPSEPDMAKLRELVASMPGRRVERRPAWTTSRLEEALQGWAAEHAARSDLRFRFDQTIGPSAARPGRRGS